MTGGPDDPTTGHRNGRVRASEMRALGEADDTLEFEREPTSPPRSSSAPTLEPIDTSDEMSLRALLEDLDEDIPDTIPECTEGRKKSNDKLHAVRPPPPDETTNTIDLLTVAEDDDEEQGL